MASNSWYVPKICNELIVQFFKEHLVILKPSIVLLACIHSLELQSSMSISVSQTPYSMLVYFLFYRNTKSDYMWFQLEKKKKKSWWSSGTLLKVLFAISGVFSWFSHVAGNIYFALLYCSPLGRYCCSPCFHPRSSLCHSPGSSRTVFSTN